MTLSASARSTTALREDRIGSTGTGPEATDPKIQAPAANSPRTKKFFDPAGTLSVAESRDVPTTNVAATVSRCRREESPLSVVASEHDQDRLRASTQPRVDCRPALSGLERGVDGIFKRHWLM
jgi:hypothetical protein